MAATKKSLAEIVQCYQNKNISRTFKPENYLDIPRVLGEDFAIDMNRLVCQHQQHVASAYMRRIRKDKIKQRDVYFKTLQNIPMKIKRVAVGPDYTDPYTKLKRRFHRLGFDGKIEKTKTPPYRHLEGSKYVPHNSLAPHMNVLFKMNPTGLNVTGNGKTTGNKNGRVEDDLPFPPSPRRGKMSKPVVADDTPRKRFSVDIHSDTTKVKDLSGSEDSTPRCPTNSPRNAFWSFNVPRELNRGSCKSHVTSIPRGKNAMAAISSVQKHNKPLPSIVSKA